MEIKDSKLVSQQFLYMLSIRPKVSQFRPIRQLMVRQVLEQPKQQQQPRTQRQQKKGLLISNLGSRHKLQHGTEYKSMLEPRDQVLEHEFHFQLQLDHLKLGRQKFIESQFFIELLKKIKKFVVEAASNITSIAFNLLCQGKLNDNQAKEYASKNKMLNIRSIFRQTITAIENNTVIRQRVKEDELKEMRKQLAVEMDLMFSHVLMNLADNYPQAPAAGGTIRMKDAIADINRVQQQANDLIYGYGIKIQDFIDEDKKESPSGPVDYTKFIMKVLNTAISAANSTEGDVRQRSLQEKFIEFSQKMFNLIHQQEYKGFISHLDIDKSARSDKDKAEVRKLITQHFNEIFQGSKDKLQIDVDGNTLESEAFYTHILKQDITRPQRHSPTTQPEQEKVRPHTKKNYQNFRQMLLKAQKSAEEFKKSNKYALGQKIPAYVKEFTRQEVQGKQFRANHSSVLRVMTKWAQNLQQIFDNPQEVVYKRLYPFKTTKNELVDLDYSDSKSAERLVMQLRAEKNKVEAQYQKLMDNCYKFLGDILSEANTEEHSTVRRYSDTRILASKINSVLTFLMLKYLNIQIHHLLAAGINIRDAKWQNRHINLIVFRVGDLLRSKLQCTQTQFISLLKTMYVLDGSQEMKGKFKMVRIKNKLDLPANNIIVNYLFMGKVQCELQLSIHQLKGKQKNNYTISHFVYQLTRGRFGAIAESAIMISQLDPMIVASKGVYYTEKIAPKAYNKKNLKPKLQQSMVNIKIQQLQQKQNKKDQSKVSFEDVVFNCFKCRRLVINQSISIFKEMKSAVCNKCQAQSKDCETRLKDKKLSTFLKEAINKNWLKRLQQGYRQVRQEVHKPCDKLLTIAKVNQRGKLSLNLAIYLKQQLRTMLVRIDRNILSHFLDKSFDFSSLDSIDLAKLIKKEQKGASADLIYLVMNQQQVNKYQQFNIKQLSDKMKQFKEAFIDFRLEKTTVKHIKAKSEIFNANKNRPKFMKLEVLVKISKGQIKADEAGLKYHKHTNLDFSALKQIHAEDIGLLKYPNWLPTFSNLTTLNLKNNKMQGEISDRQLPSCLNNLYLSWNKLTKVNVSNLNKLKELHLDNNKLTQIDLRHDMPNLNALYLNSNQLKSIYLGHNLPNLSLLDVHYNSLSSIQNLMVKSLRKLSCDMTIALGIDFSGGKDMDELQIYKGKPQRSRLCNLPETVKIKASSS